MARPNSSGLAEVIDTILDKGLVIDAFVRVSLVGIELVTIDARIVVASVDTYLRFAEAVNRLEISQTEPKGLPEIVGGRAGIAGVGDALALSQPIDHALRRLHLVVLVHGQPGAGRLVDAIGAQQSLRVTRVLAGDRIGQLQHVQRPQADVGQVADGRGHDVQRGLPIMLRSRRVTRGGQG